jgi:hypothetical protein
VSDHDHEAAKSPAQRTLDLFVYAPVGALLSAVEEFPEMANKGRARLEVQLKNARVIGQFVVNSGSKDIERRLRRRSGADSSTAPSAERDSHETGATITQMTPGQSKPDEVSMPTVAAERYDNPLVDQALPGYDTLSASQVVRRLDGLGPDELQAVYHHEAATRGRRTILHRTQQLLGTEDPPGTAASSPV